MALCAGIRADGGRCGAQAMRNSQWCMGHDPEQAETRRRRASKGGRRGGVTFDAFIHETERWRAAYKGGHVPERHPLIEALRNARDPVLSRQSSVSPATSALQVRGGKTRVGSGPW